MRRQKFLSSVGDRIAAGAGHFGSAKRRYALLVCAVISVAALVLLGFRVNAVKYALDVHVRGLQATISDGDRDFSIPAAYLVTRIDGVGAISVDGSRLGHNGPYSLLLDGANASLASFPVPAGASLTIASHGSSGVDVTTRPPSNTSFQFDFVLDSEKAATYVERSGMSAVLPASSEPRIVTLTSAPTGAMTVYLTPALRAKTCDASDDPAFLEPALDRISVSRIAFADTSRDLSATTTSTILQGALRFPSLEKETPLGRGDALILTGTAASVASLRILPCDLGLELSGTTTTARVGTVGDTIDARPTYLEAATHDKNFAFILSAILSMWGFLWGLRELLLPAEEQRK